MKVSKEIERKLRRINKLAQEQTDLCCEVSKYFEKKGVDLDAISSGTGCGLDSVEYGECSVDEFLEYLDGLNEE